MNVELRIEELVLHGFPPGDSRRICDAVEYELSRLFAERGVPHSLIQGSEVAHLDGGEFEMAQGTRPAVIGGRVAQTVYEGLDR